MSILRISLLGSVRIMHDDRQNMLNVTHTTQALLAYLLLFSHRPQPRDILIEVLWGDRDQAHARNCLNTALWRLRRVLEPEGISPGTYLLTTPTGGIGFNWRSPHQIDATLFEAEINRALKLPLEAMAEADAQRLHEALQLHTGELLEDFYADWALRERERLRQLYLNGLVHLMRYHQQCGSYDQGLELGRQILGVDPLREEIHRDMMRLYVANGQRAQAIQQYQTCRDLLYHELGIMPMHETQLLFAQIAPPADAAPRDLTETTVSPDVHDALQQLRATLRGLDKAHAQIQQSILLIEQLNTQCARRDRQPHQ